METIFFLVDAKDIDLFTLNNINGKKFPQTADAVVNKLKTEYPSIRQTTPQELVRCINVKQNFFQDKWVGVFYVEDLF
jgi:hypothetical protein